MYHTVYLDQRIAITPAEINMISSPDSVKEILTTKLKEKFESKCTANGFVRPDSIEILARSMGVAENGRFTGNLLYDCKIKCDVLYPTAGSELPVMIIKVRKMGAYGHYDDAIRVLLPRDMHVGNKEFDEIKEGDVVRVRLERSRFQANDPFIMAVGTLLSETPREAGEAGEAAAAERIDLTAAAAELDLAE
jgi:DNA-directed RNA polymerase subunit E'/Rpb7